MSERTVTVRLRAVTDQYTRAMRDAAGSTEQLGRRGEQVGRTMTRRVTAPLMAVAGAATHVGMQFESAMSGVEAVTGQSGAALERMSAQAQELGRTTQFSASQAAGALEFLGMAGFDAEESLEALPHTLDLAAASGMDLARSADLASNVLGQFALDADETQRVADVLAEASRNANTSVEQLGQALQMAGPVANAAGLDIEETAAAIAAMGDSGIQASQAGTSLRMAMTQLLNASGPAADTLEELGINAAQADGTLRPLPDIIDELGDSGATAADIMTIFGQRAGPAMAALIEQGGDALRDLEGALDDSAGAAAEQAEVRMDNLQGTLRELRSAAEGAGIALFDAGIGDALEAIAGGARDSLQWVAELPQPLQSTGVALGGVAATAGPAAVGIGTLAQAAPAIASNFRLGVRQLRRFARFMTGPWGIAIAGGIAALSLLRETTVDTTHAVGALEAELDGAAASLGNLTDEFLIEQLRDQGVLGTFNEMGLSLDDLREAMLGSETALGRLRPEFEDAAWSGEHWSDALHNVSMGLLGTESETDQLAQTLMGLIEGTEEYQEAARQLQIEQSGLEDSTNKTATATQLLRDQAGRVPDDLGDAASGIDGMGGAADDAASSIDTLSEALEGLSGAARSAEEAHRRVLDAIETLDDAVAESSTTLDIHSEAGRQNREALQGAAEAIAEKAEAVLDETGSTEEAVAAAERHYESLLDAAEAAGIGRDAAAEYIDELGLIPEDIATALDLVSDEAIRDAQLFQAELDGIPRHIAVRASFSWRGDTRPGPVAAPQFHSGVDRVPADPALARAWGLRSDEVPAILQVGETVLPRLHDGGVIGDLPSRASERVGVFDQRMLDWTVDLFADAETSADFDRAFATLDQLEDIRRDAEQVVSLWDRLTELQERHAEADDAEERARLAEEIADAEADIARHYQDRSVAREREAAEMDAEIARNREQWELEQMSAREREQWLRSRRDEFTRFSDEWMRWERERQSAQDEVNRLVEEERAERQRIADEAVDELNRMLDERDRIRGQMAEREERYERDVAEARRRHQERVDREVAQRRDELRFDPTQRLDFVFGNRPEAIAANVQDQIDAVLDSERLLEDLRARGLDDAVIEALGLDDPRQLRTLEEFARATDGELADLNDSILERNRVAGDRAERDAERTYTSLGSTLMDMRGDLDDELADLNDSFQDDIREMNREFAEDMDEMRVELAEIGEDTGRDHSEAIAEGIEAGIPAIVRAAERAREAARQARDPGPADTSGGGAGGAGTMRDPASGRTVHVTGDSEARMFLDRGWERAHTGGLIAGRGEVPIIARGGERVVTDAQNRELMELLRELSGGQRGPLVHIERNEMADRVDLQAFERTIAQAARIVS